MPLQENLRGGNQYPPISQHTVNKQSKLWIEACGGNALLIQGIRKADA